MRVALAALAALAAPAAGRAPSSTSPSARHGSSATPAQQAAGGSARAGGAASAGAAGISFNSRVSTKASNAGSSQPADVPLFGDYMVLQQAPAKACVFGTLGSGGVGASVVVSGSSADADFAPYELEAEVVQEGAAPNKWKACLRPGSAGGDHTITATCQGCTNTTAAVIKHVQFGDVWYCGGQSNMALPLLHSYTRNASRDAILAGNYSNIRIHGLEGNMNPFQPWATLKQALAAPSSFRQPDPEAPGQHVDSDSSSLMTFSASCYYFGQGLTDQLAARGPPPPIGLIHTAWGGSAIAQWLSNSSVATCKLVKPNSADQEWHDSRVLPYVGMTLKGWAWYQGENDMHGVMGNAAASTGYSCMMQALVQQWRSLWSQVPGTTDPEAPFGIVTLASSGSEGANGLAMGAMRQAQTANLGVLPGPKGSVMANTFLAQAYDLDDEWSGDRGPCTATGWNVTSPAHHCCGADANASFCPPEWAAKCRNMCACFSTKSYMGSIHPRSKKPVGDRLAKAAYNLLYGGEASFTGPTLAGCALSQTELVIHFSTGMLRGDKVVLQRYGKPSFVPYYHGHGNPAFIGGSQLWVQTRASSFCAEVVSVNATNTSAPVYCPTWAGGQGESVTQPAPAGRFPTFGGSGATTANDPADFNMGWINLPIAAGPTASSISVDLSPLKGAQPTAVRYAWGIINCCDITDPDTFTSKPCIANCPIMGSSGLPANPFIARIKDAKCECIAPQVCGEA